MATILDITKKTEIVEIKPKTEVTLPVKADASETVDVEKVKPNDEKPKAEDEPKSNPNSKDKTEKEVAVEIEPKTGISFPVKLNDRQQLYSIGVRKKSVLGLGIKIYCFGIYSVNEELKQLLRSKIGKTPEKPTKELYQVVIDSDVEMTVRMVIIFGSLSMSLVKKNFNESLGASIKKFNGGRKNEELTKMIMGNASDNMKIATGTVIEITRLPGYIIQTKVKNEVVGKVESELLCRAYFDLYLGDDAFDKEAKEKFGTSLL